MEDYQNRVVVEKKELDEKIERLNNFINGSIFKNLSPEEASLLHAQYSAMTQYSITLGFRIEVFERKVKEANATLEEAK
jgi:hypothetical protein